MRHTYAELGLEAGAPLEAVSQSLGNAEIGITKKLYAPDFRGGLNAKAIDTLDKFLNPDISVPKHWSTGSESITSQTILVTDAVQLSKSPGRTRLVTRGNNA